MARIRTIKPEFFTSEDIVSMSPLARLLYIALWCESDREGRLVWKPKTFKMRYFPGDSCNIEKLCAEIVETGLVVLYGSYAYIPAFHAHQHINPREAVSQIPEPDLSTETTRAPRVSDASPRDSDTQVGREGKGKEGKGKEGVATPDGVSDSVFQDFKKLRTAKKSPLTQTALDGIAREAKKAGLSLGEVLAMCCERGWVGFKAEWTQEKRSAYLPPQPNETIPAKTGIDPTLAKLNAEAAFVKPPSAEMRAKLAALKEGRLQ